MLQEFAPSLYLADGPVVSFYGFPYPTRMAVAKLSDGRVMPYGSMGGDGQPQTQAMIFSR